MSAAAPCRALVARALGCAALLGLAAAPAWSQEPPASAPPGGLRYRLEAGFGFSDNRLRTPVDAQDDFFFQALAGFTLEGSSTRLAWRGSGQLQASRSLQGGRDEPPRAALALALDWTLLEQRLSWHLAQLAAIEQIDPLQADSPDNRQQTRISVTGPSLLFGTPATWLARIDARLALARAEESPDFDHRRHTLAASLQRHSTPLLDWSLLGEHSEVSFRRDGGANDFSRNDLWLRAARRLPHGELMLAYGRTAVDRARGEDLRGPLWQLGLRLAPRAGTELELQYADALSDAGRDLSLLDDPAERLWQEGRRGRIDAALYRLRNLGLAWRRAGARLDWSLASFLRQVDYVEPDAVGEGRSHGVRAGLGYRLSPRWTLQFDAAAARVRFVGLPREDRDRGLRLGLERHLAPHWSLRLGLSRFLRRSSQADAGYGENLLALVLIYRSDP